MLQPLVPSNTNVRDIKRRSQTEKMFAIDDFSE